MPEGVELWHLMRLRPNNGQRERVSVTIEDSDAGLGGYEPPGKDYTVARGRGHFRDMELPDGSLLALFPRDSPRRGPKASTQVRMLLPEVGGRRCELALSRHHRLRSVRLS